MDYQRAIERYYRAYRNRDREELRSLLASDCHFVSPFGSYDDRDAMLDDIWPRVGQTWATNLRIFGTGREFVVLYEHESASGLANPGVTVAEHIRFRDDRIAGIEVFLGRSPAPSR
jgi:hypothetical protein